MASPQVQTPNVDKEAEQNPTYQGRARTKEDGLATDPMATKESRHECSVEQNSPNPEFPVLKAVSIRILE